MARKRTADNAYDGSLYYRAPKQSRMLYDGEQRARNSMALEDMTPGDVWDYDDDLNGELEEEEEEEEDVEQEAPDATQGYSQQHYNYLLYGALDDKIVGVRYYNGYATEGETVVLRREPHNQYDANAIRIDNVQGEQIGHIPRGLAAKLAKYMDDRSLLIEARITGHKGYYECPIELLLYGTDDPVQRQQLMARMKKDRLPVGRASERQRREAAEKKEQERRAKEAAKKTKKKGAKAVGPIEGPESSMAEFAAGLPPAVPSLTGPSLEDIITGSERFNPRNIEEFVEEFGVKEEDLAKMPQAPQPNALFTELHPFQLQGLQWMLDKESPKLPTKQSKNVVQLWRPHTNVPDVYTNVATSFSVKNPTLASGGILADDMGLGKTIQTISLIVADRELGRGAKDATGATLILAPVSVMSNWSTQMEHHIKPEHALRVMFWHGQKKEPITPKSIEKYDIVISTYESISSDWFSQKSTSLPRKSGPFSIKWRRVILDEGHNIRNPKAKKTVAISHLMAQSRWSLTGTPIINNLKDLYSQVRFLRLSGGIENFDVFHSTIMRPVMQGHVSGQQVLQKLMSDICLRRKKEMSFIDLRLPPLSEYIHKVKLLPHEQEKYNVLEAEAKGQLDKYRKSIGKKDAATTYRHLLEVLLRLRQVCNHWQLVGTERLDSIMQQLDENGAVDLTDETKLALQKLLQLSIDSQEDCPICLDMYKDPLITTCAHTFCTPCLERILESTQKCPLCRSPLESLLTSTVKPAKHLQPPAAPSQQEILDKESLERNTSTKIQAILSILSASHKDATAKTIIFSQWPSFLSLLSPHLTAHSYSYTRIDGSMPPSARDTALHTFTSSPSTTILLASLSVCSVGLNLVAANQVILSDSWWAPAIEDQAVDRVHRLGQTRETRVWRVVVEGSVEERVLGIQEEKRRVVGVAFGEKDEGRRKRREGGLGDLVRLLGGQEEGGTREAQA